MTDREKLCKEFTELTGGHWHERVWFKSFDDGMSFEQVCSCGYHTAHDISIELTPSNLKFWPKACPNCVNNRQSSEQGDFYVPRRSERRKTG